MTTFLFWSLQISDISNLDSKRAPAGWSSPVHLVGKPLNPDSPGALRSVRKNLRAAQAMTILYDPQSLQLSFILCWKGTIFPLGSHIV